jgi:uncharacterized protein
MAVLLPVFLQFVVGLIFGLGLVVSGMSNPAKVLNFLDFGSIAAGGWDPSLAFVMAGAVAVTFVGFRMVLARSRPVFAERFHAPSARELDLRILAGPAIFGTGWGLAGFCPGPAFVALGYATRPAFIFVAAMLLGMWLARSLGRLPRLTTAVDPLEP